MFGFPEPGVIFYGHNHLTSDVTGAVRCVNPGSLGCNPEPYARFAVLTIDDSGNFAFDLRQVPYDRDALLRELERREVPARKFIREAFFGA